MNPTRNFLLKTILISFLTVFCLSSVHSQTVAEAEYPFKRDIQKGKFEKVESKIERRLHRDSNNMECHYAAYWLYSTPDFSGLNLEKAYTHLLRVRTLFSTADPNLLDRWARDSYSGALLDCDLRRICSLAIQQARSLHTLDAYQHFLNYFSHALPDQHDSIVNCRDSLEFRQIRDIGTFDMLQDFILRRPHSLVLNDAVRLRDSLAFLQADSKHTTPAYELFLQTYPNSHLLARATDSIHLIEYRHALHYNAEQYYRSYGQRYPESPYTPRCTHLADSLEYCRTIDTSHWQSLIHYLDSHNRRSHWTDSALRNLVHFALQHHHIPAAEQAAARLLPSDTLFLPVADMLHRAYLHTSIRNFHRFYQRHPNLMPHSQRHRDSLALQLYQNYHYHIIDSCIHAIAPCREAFLMLQQLLKDDIDHHRWRAAIATALHYADDFADNYDYLSLLSTLQASNQNPSKASPLGTSVNSAKGNEYAPVISADGNTLYFAAKDRPDNIGGEDIFVTHRKGNNWSPATILMDLSHTYGNEAPVSVSPDGTTLLLYQSGLLYQADRTADGWHTHRLPNHINGSNWQTDATLAANGRLLLWAANGRTDREVDSSVNIYASLLDSNGQWGEPFELGPAINTPFDERSPFLHPDMHTLYFCSESHGSLGQMDLFMSTRLSDNSWTHWSQPVNIGKEFNTTDDNWGYKISTDGTRAYYARADRSQDIYSATLPKAMRPQPVAILSGTVTDHNQRPVSTRIHWEDLATGQPLGQCHTDPSTGRYLILLPLGIHYGLYIHDSLYFPTSWHLNLSSGKDSTNVNATQNITVLPYTRLIDEGQTTTLNNVTFGLSNWQFDPTSQTELRRLAAIAKQRNLNIEIHSHVDGNPDNPSNTQLTQRRAEEIRQYLIGLGCPPAKVTAKGHGSNHPVTRRGSLHHLNRRIEVRLQSTSH